MADYEIKALELLFQRPLEPVLTSERPVSASPFPSTEVKLESGFKPVHFPVSNIASSPSPFPSTEVKLDSGFKPARFPVSNIASSASPFPTTEVKLESRFGDNMRTKISLQNSDQPNIDFALQIGKKECFYVFLDLHREVAGKLIQLFMDAPDRSSFISLAAYVKDRINPVLFQYAYSIAVQHRKDTTMVTVPSIAELFPANFIEPSLLRDGRAEGTLFTNPGDRMTIDMSQNFTASEKEQEQRLAYFREDIGVNMHHWHWHLVYPGEGPESVVRKDRRGELFYYMHHQMIARYNIERFCNGLPKARTLSNLREAIPEGYFPKILSSLNNRTYPARITGQHLRNIERENNTIEISEVERWVDRIHQAIDQGYVVDRTNRKIPLDEVKGIDILGDMIEASSLTVNRQLYGNIHNMGHNLISLAHDPDARFKEDIGVMGDVTTAMRDPIFYRWHTFIDQIFNKFKDLLTTYDNNQLGFNGISVDSINAQIRAKGTTPNILATYWQHSDIDIGAALDFGPNGAIYARYTHLQYAPFSYVIRVSNTGAARRGTCRIFLCPKTDERGAVLKMNDVKNLAIELDKFTVTLNPGANTIRRRSKNSSVTIPFERSFRRVGENYAPKNAGALADFRFCGCGWPDHMLLPKGTKGNGMEYDLFVMISDFTGDEVRQINDEPTVCGDADSFCGLKDKFYPDKRAMGFPFDRRITAASLEDFTGQYTNMAMTSVRIIFTEKHVNRPKNRE